MKESVEKFIVFYNKLDGKKLLSISFEESHEVEIEATLGLLAYETGIEESNIEVRYERNCRKI